jgi:hypothetical protein
MPAGSRSAPGGTGRSAVPAAPSPQHAHRAIQPRRHHPRARPHADAATAAARPLVADLARCRPPGRLGVGAGHFAPPAGEWIAAELNRLELELGDELAARLRAAPAGLRLERAPGSRPTVEDAAALVTNRVYRSLMQPATADPAEMNATAITNALQARGAGLAEARRLATAAAGRFGGRAWFGQLPAGRQSDRARPLWRLQMPAGALRDSD